MGVSTYLIKFNTKYGRAEDNVQAGIMVIKSEFISVLLFLCSHSSFGCFAYFGSHSFDVFLLIFFISVSAIPTGLFLMPAINSASDNGIKRKFLLLHSLSLLITIAHIIMAGFALYLL